MPARGEILSQLVERVNALAEQDPVKTKDFCHACQALEPFFDNLGRKCCGWIDLETPSSVLHHNHPPGTLFHFAKSELVHKVGVLTLSAHHSSGLYTCASHTPLCTHAQRETVVAVQDQHTTLPDVFAAECAVCSWLPQTTLAASKPTHHANTHNPRLLSGWSPHSQA